MQSNSTIGEARIGWWQKQETTGVNDIGDLFLFQVVFVVN
jgi:hypothetical protein